MLYTVKEKKMRKLLDFKKKTLLVLFFVLIFGILFSINFSFASNKAYANEEPKQVSLKEFQYFNIYSEDSSYVVMGMAKFGMLLRFDDVLSDNRSEINGGIKSLNLIEEYGKNIFINDMPLDFYTDAEVSYYFEEYMWVYIPNLDSYRKISVNEPFVFLDREIKPFALYSAVSNVYGFEYTYWTEDGSAYVNTKTQNVEFKGITFNNVGYRYFSPKNGLLLAFDRKNENGEWMNINLSNTMSEKEGSLMKINLLNHNVLSNKFLGEGKSVGENILLDGIPLKDIKDAEINYHSERYLWIYAPNMMNYTKLEIIDHTLFLDSFLPGKVLYTNGNEWLEYDPNASRRFTTGIRNVSYEGIAWNNYDFGWENGKNGVLIKFSDNLSKLPNEILGSVGDVNKVNTKLGDHVKLNEISLNNIPNAEISYYNEKYLWVYLPSENLSLSGGDYPHLTIDEGTEFLNSKLPYVSLYFDGSYWQESIPNSLSYPKNDFDSVIQNNVQVEDKEGYVYTVLSFENDFSPAADSRPNFAQTGDVGDKISINGKSLNEIYKVDKNIRCSWSEIYGRNTLYLLIRKADLSTTSAYPITTLEIEDSTKFMNKTIGSVTLYLVDGMWSTVKASSSVSGEDNESPYMYYYGDDNYLFMTGEEVIDFSQFVYAYDERDGEIPVSVIISAEAITGGKWNHGKWQVKVTAVDSHNNKSEIEIPVSVINEEEQFLSVYVNGIFSYRARYGDLLQKDKSEDLLKGDPEKADSSTSYYVFTGWAFNGKLWDFANDIITEDVWLSPTYREYRRLYTLTISDPDSDETEVMTVKYGDIIDFADYQKDGYLLLAKVDDTVVKRVTINNDVYVELSYIQKEESINSTTAIIILACCFVGASLLFVGAIIIFKKFSKKAGNKQ